MSEPFIGQIILFGGSFAPRGWAFCDGQVMSVAQNTALFSILGTAFGGNGQTTFGLPDLRGRVPVHAGGGSPGPGLSAYVLGEMTGTETVMLATQQMPAHSHMIAADASPGSSSSPSAGNLAETAGGDSRSPTLDTSTYTTGNPANPVTLNPATIQSSGGNQPHPNIQPVLGLNFIIALDGLYPSRP